MLSSAHVPKRPRYSDRDELLVKLNTAAGVSARGLSTILGILAGRPKDASGDVAGGRYLRRRMQTIDASVINALIPYIRAKHMS
jgi:hypothetical protein